jgi:hypothetical protein
MTVRRVLFALLSLSSAGAIAAACGGDDNINPIDAGQDTTASDAPGQTDTGGGGNDAQSDTSQSETGGDAAPDAPPVDRGPTTIPFAGDPNGLYWDYGVGAALYIADSTNNKIVKWVDGAGFSDAAKLPDVPDSGDPTLGGVVRLLDGTLVTTRFGFGQYGAVIVVKKDGDAGVVGATQPDGSFTPLSTSRRRIGFAILADGTLVDTYFTGGGDAGRIGAVAKVNLITGKETDVLTGLSKPVGVVYNEGSMYVSDQGYAYLIKSPTTGGAFVDPDAGVSDAGDGGDADAGPQPSVFASYASPDLICQGPDGVIFSGSTGGTVFQIDRKGTVTNLVTGLKSARGCAYDGANKRLFVAEHDPAGTAHAIRIVPVP